MSAVPLVTPYSTLTALLRTNPNPSPSPNPDPEPHPPGHSNPNPNPAPISDVPGPVKLRSNEPLVWGQKLSDGHQACGVYVLLYDSMPTTVYSGVQVYVLLAPLSDNTILSDASPEPVASLCCRSLCSCL